MAQTPPRDSIPVHTQFVRDHLHRLAADLIGQYSIQPGRPLQLAPMPGDTVSTLFEEIAASELTDRGVLLRSSDHDVDDRTRRLFAYRFDRFNLRLTSPYHRSFLGRVMLQRELSVALTVRISDPSDDDRELWSQSVDTVVTDTIPKKAVMALSDSERPFYSPTAPSTTLEKLQIPILGGALIGVAGLALIVF